MIHARRVRDHCMSGHGLQAQIDRVQRENEKLRRRFVTRTITEMGIAPDSGPAMLLLDRYSPTDSGFEHHEVQSWLDDHYAPANRLDQEDS